MESVYGFRQGKAAGSARMKDLLGGKGANLAEMARMKLPVPAGFTISTEVCNYYYRHGQKYPPGLRTAVRQQLADIERAMDAKFGDAKHPLLLSVRSGARRSMPGMMETVLNVGLTPKTIPGLVGLSGNPRFVFDAYRRLLAMYADVVMEKAAGVEPEEGKGIRVQLDRMLAAVKERRGYRSDAEMTAEELEALCAGFKKRIRAVLGRDFPDDPKEQLWGAIGAVFTSWNGKRAVSYRRIEGIPDEWGTAVNVQAMVFGNRSDASATGVAFTRNPATGENGFYGEWLPNAQGEDVVAGIRTPNPLNDHSRSEQNRELVTLEERAPDLYRELDDVRLRLERHYRDMQDIEFTIEEGRLWILQCRTGKRTGRAALEMALDMLDEGLIDRPEAVMRVAPDQVDELLHPVVDPAAEKKHVPIARGLPAGPGGASGRIVFTAAAAVEASKRNERVVLVREETNPEDVEGMRAADGILTSRGGMTSHAALVARGWGKCCIVGCAGLRIDAAARSLRVGDRSYTDKDALTLNGTKGYVYDGRLPMVDATENPRFAGFMEMADGFRVLRVRTNAEDPADAAQARRFGAEGIGLFRTEHMFYGPGSEEPLLRLRKMIVARDERERRAALEELYPFIKQDIKATLEVMDGLPVTIRLLDPPLHEFVPREPENRRRLAASLDISPEELDRRADALHESNPMMGHRGVRLGVTYPGITETWARAIFEAAAELMGAGKKPRPEIMVPVVAAVEELRDQKEIVTRVHDAVCRRHRLKRIRYHYGTMIEVPRAALTAGRIAGEVDFFSFGTNDLTQLGFGFSRDDFGSFLPDYLDKRLLPADPFQRLDQDGIGELVKMGVDRGRAANPELEVGICGEHGGDPGSVAFCHRAGLDYVSCSPFRVPVARLAAAQAALAGGRDRRRRARRR